MFWTIRESPASSGATLCDECALVETNSALAEFGIAPFDSMTEAALILTTLLAAIGDAGEHFTTSEFGFCPCGKREAS